MRLGLVGISHPLRGGIAQHTTLLCQALRREHPVYFLTMCRQYPGFLFPGRTQYDTSETGPRSANEPLIDALNPLSWRTAARALLASRPDAVLFIWWHPFFALLYRYLAWRCRRRGIPVYFLCHNALPHDRHWFDGALLRLALGSARGILAHTRFIAEQVSELLPGTEVRISPHPVYDNFLPPARDDGGGAKDRLGLGGKDVVLFFGLIRRYKGLDRLLAAFEMLPAEFSCHLLVVGEFYDERQRYAAALERLALAGRLTLVDRFVPNEAVADYFLAADVVALPYLRASQSGVGQLATAFERPVITTAAGGLAEAVEPGRTGLVLPEAEPAALAQAIREFFAAGGRRSMATDLQRARESNTWDGLATSVLSLIRDTAKGQG